MKFNFLKELLRKFFTRFPSLPKFHHHYKTRLNNRHLLQSLNHAKLKIKVLWQDSLLIPFQYSSPLNTVPCFADCKISKCENTGQKMLNQYWIQTFVSVPAFSVSSSAGFCCSAWLFCTPSSWSTCILSCRELHNWMQRFAVQFSLTTVDYGQHTNFRINLKNFCFTMFKQAFWCSVCIYIFQMKWKCDSAAWCCCLSPLHNYTKPCEYSL